METEPGPGPGTELLVPSETGQPAGQAPPPRSLPGAQAGASGPSAGTRNGLQPQDLSFQARPREGAGLPRSHSPGAKPPPPPGPHQRAQGRGCWGPRAHLAHPAASGSIAPGGAGAGPGHRREAPPEPRDRSVRSRRRHRRGASRPASLEFGSGPRGRVGPALLKGPRSSRPEGGLQEEGASADQGPAIPPPSGPTLSRAIPLPPASRSPGEGSAPPLGVAPGKAAGPGPAMDSGSDRARALPSHLRLEGPPRVG